MELALRQCLMVVSTTGILLYAEASFLVMHHGSALVLFINLVNVVVMRLVLGQSWMVIPTSAILLCPEVKSSHYNVL